MSCNGSLCLRVRLLPLFVEGVQSAQSENLHVAVVNNIEAQVEKAFVARL